MDRRRWLVLGAAALYALSLAIPAVHGPGFPAQSGMDMLNGGAEAWRDNVFAWYANPVFWLAAVLLWFERTKLGLAFACIGLLLALSSFMAATLAERSGRNVPEFSFAWGFYVWLAAFVLTVAAGWLGIYKVSDGRTEEDPAAAGRRRD